MCMDVLIQKLFLESATSNSGLGIKLCSNGFRVPCLMFADYNLVICKGTTSACNNLKRIVDEFCQMFDQFINFHKSTLIFSRNIPNSKRASLASHFNMASSAHSGRYLEIHFSSFRPLKRLPSNPTKNSSTN